MERGPVKPFFFLARIFMMTELASLMDIGSFTSKVVLCVVTPLKEDGSGVIKTYDTVFGSTNM